MAPDEYEQQYGLLRGWYLAHLRKGALVEQEKMQMTPAGLIAADQNIVARLALNKASITAKKEPVKPPSVPLGKLTLRLTAIWVVSCLSFWVWLLIDSGADVAQAWRYYVMLTVDVWLENSTSSARLPISPLFLVLPAVFYGVPLIAVIIVILKAQNLRPGQRR